MKHRPPVPVSDDDARLFREALGDQVRAFDPVEPTPAAPKPEPQAHMLEADEAAVPGELLDMAFDPGMLEVGEELSYLRDGYPPKLLRQLNVLFGLCVKRHSRSPIHLRGDGLDFFLDRPGDVI